MDIFRQNLSRSAKRIQANERFDPNIIRIRPRQQNKSAKHGIQLPHVPAKMQNGTAAFRLNPAPRRRRQRKSQHTDAGANKILPVRRIPTVPLYLHRKCRVHPPAKGFSGFGSKNRHSLRTVFYASCAVLPISAGLRRRRFLRIVLCASCAVLPISVSPRRLPLSACNLFFAAILQTAFQKRLRGPLSGQLAVRKIRLR